MLKYPTVLFKRCLNLAGLRVSRLKYDYNDMRGNSSPIRSIAALGSLTPILYDLDLEDCRLGNLAIQAHPYFLALMTFPGETERIAKWLELYYRALSATSAADYLGFGVGECEALEKESIRFNYYPWELRNIDEFKADISMHFESESRREGFDCKMNSIDLNESWIKIQSQQQAQRLLRLRQKMASNGYIRNEGPDGDCKAILLIGGNERCSWLSSRGHHRVVVAYSLGIKKIPVRIVRIIRKSDCKYWPGVVSGVFKPSSAQSFFDRLIEAHGSESHINAINSANNSRGISEDI
jgi:hypothetical protein